MWIKVLGMNGNVRLVNLDNVSVIENYKTDNGTNCVDFSFNDGSGCLFNATVEAVENEIAEYYARKGPFEKTVRSEQERWLNGE